MKQSTTTKRGGGGETITASPQTPYPGKVTHISLTGLMKHSTTTTQRGWGGGRKDDCLTSDPLLLPGRLTMSVLPLVPQAGLQNPTTHHTYSHETSFGDMSKCFAICLSLLLLGCVCYCSCFGWINYLVVICCCYWCSVGFLLSLFVSFIWV